MTGCSTPSTSLTDTNQRTSSVASGQAKQTARHLCRCLWTPLESSAPPLDLLRCRHPEIAWRSGRREAARQAASSSSHGTGSYGGFLSHRSFAFPSSPAVINRHPLHTLFPQPRVRSERTHTQPDLPQIHPSAPPLQGTPLILPPPPLSLPSLDRRSGPWLGPGSSTSVHVCVRSVFVLDPCC
jgi:hypothetical protein